MSNKVLLGLMSVVIVGCSATPELHHYALPHPASSTERVSIENADRLELRLDVPDYLRSRRLVLMGRDNEILTTHYHRWSESLHLSMKSHLLESFTVTNQAKLEGRLDVKVVEFYGDLDGYNHLRANWHFVSEISNAHEAAACQTEGEYHQQLSQLADGYGALVDAHGRLLQMLAESIAATIEEQCS